MSDGYEFLTREHRQVESMFQQYRQQPDDALAHRIAEALTLHTEAEEAALYPQLRKYVDGGDDLAADAEDEHATVKSQIARLYEAPPTDLVALMGEIEQNVADHVRREEQEIFPAMRESGVDGDGLARALERAQGEAPSRSSSGNVG
jgi:hemerythrin superfamily protein